MLFPEILPSGPSTGGPAGDGKRARGGPTALALRAANGPLLDAKRRVSYFELPTRQFVTRCANERLPFQWTINPYRGCEYGCKYCYARYTHEFLELRRPEQFEELIYAKEFSATAFQRELERIPARDWIAIGTATDPYQPAERRYRVTRRILEVFAAGRSRRLSITTKSDLVAADIDMLLRVAEGNAVQICMTITTVDEALARLLEPFAPRPSLRVDAIQRLTSAGIRVTVMASPVIPLITDSRSSLEAVASAAKDAGASYLFGGVLFLKACSQAAFFPFLEEQFPRLVRRYRERYGRSPFLRGQYPEMISHRLEEIRERYGLNQRRGPDDPPLTDYSPQLSLFDELVDARIASNRACTDS